MTTPSPDIIREILRRTNKIHPEDELNCGACGYNSCQEKASAVYWGLAENEMCLPYLIDQLEENLNRLAQSHKELGGNPAAVDPVGKDGFRRPAGRRGGP